VVISVLKQRSRIWLRRAFGATKGHGRIHFLAKLADWAGVGTVAVGVGLAAHSAT